MKRNTQSTIAILLVSVSIVSVVLVEAFSEKLRTVEWFDVEVFIIPVIVCFAVGTILGWMNFRSLPGKLAALLGTGALIWIFLVFFSKSGGAGI